MAHEMAQLIVMHTAELCNGSTTDSDSVCLGSSPSSATKEKNARKSDIMEYILISGLSFCLVKC